MPASPSSIAASACSRSRKASLASAEDVTSVPLPLLETPTTDAAAHRRPLLLLSLFLYGVAAVAWEKHPRRRRPRGWAGFLLLLPTAADGDDDDDGDRGGSRPRGSAEPGR